MTKQFVAWLEKNGLFDIERTISLLAEVYVATHRDTTPDRALTDIDADLKNLIGARYSWLADIAWKYISPALAPTLQSAVAAAYGVASNAGTEVSPLPPSPGGQTAD